MKGRFFKTICGVICTALLCIPALTACGGGSDGPVGPGGDSGWWETTGELQKDGNGNVVFNNVQVKLSTVVAGEDRPAFEQIVARFNLEYMGKINIISTSLLQDSYENTVAQQIRNNNNAPDLLMSHLNGHSSFVENKLIQPFNEAIEKSGIEINLSNYSDELAVYSDLGREGNLFSVPVDAQSTTVLYNKQILEECGLTLPTDHAEFLAVCEAVAEQKGIIPIAWNIADEFFLRYTFPTAIIQNGGTLYNEGTFKADWYDDEENRKVFEDVIASIREMGESQPALASLTMDDATALSNFLNNRALFYFDVAWTLDDVLKAYASANNIAEIETVIQDYIGGTSISNWFALDPEEPNASKILGDSHFFALSSTVEDINVKAACLEFIKWFTQTASVGADWAEAGHLSVSKIITADGEYASNEIVTNYLNHFYPNINDFTCVGLTPYFNDMSNSLKTLFSTAIRSDPSNVTNIIKTQQDNLNGIIDFVNM